ncbi:unnamed protein product [Moneuplotes crassus]|uniref:EF-hand domain-containing protein n=1 Tax=Euplotes crassus TaxID=5936 RepID=A0AAD1XZ13_EUPCR|nr:unnamed protein product [Moneuplotes crassus]
MKGYEVVTTSLKRKKHLFEKVPGKGDEALKCVTTRMEKSIFSPSGGVLRTKEILTDVSTNARSVAKKKKLINTRNDPTPLTLRSSIEKLKRQKYYNGSSSFWDESEQDKDYLGSIYQFVNSNNKKSMEEIEKDHSSQRKQRHQNLRLSCDALSRRKSQIDSEAEKSTNRTAFKKARKSMLRNAFYFASDNNEEFTYRNFRRKIVDMSAIKVIDTSTHNQSQNVNLKSSIGEKITESDERNRTIDCHGKGHKTILKMLRRAGTDKVKQQVHGQRQSLKLAKKPTRPVSYKKKYGKIKPAVKSFRTKDDPYMRLTSRYENKKDAQDRDRMGHEVLINFKRTNHIQNAIREWQREKGKVTSGRDSSNGKNNESEEDEVKTGEYQLKRKYHEKDQFNRISSLMATNRNRFGMRKSSENENIDHFEYEKEELEKKILDKNKVYYELIRDNDKFHNVDELIGFDISQWLRKRGYLAGDRVNIKDQIEFAKKLFFSWDDDGSGVLEIDEISEPLITLGLAPDKKFVVQLIKSLDSKFESIVDEELSITLKDFLKIFRNDRLKKDFVLKSERKLKLPSKTTKVEIPSITESPVPPLNMKNKISAPAQRSRYNEKLSDQDDLQAVRNLQVGNVGIFSKQKTHIEGRNKANLRILNSQYKSRAERGKDNSKIPSLVEQIKIVREYWSIADEGRMDYEVPLPNVTKLLVNKQVAPDLEIAKKIVRSVQKNKSSAKVNYDEFKRIFCKAIFKSCLLALIKEIIQFNPFNDKILAKKDEEEILPVSVRSIAYQRTLLKKGISSEDPGLMKIGKEILNSLAEFKNMTRPLTDEQIDQILNRGAKVDTPSSLASDDFNYKVKKGMIYK